jgi:hypothetical protein
MNILSCLLVLFGLVSSWVIYKESKKEGTPFSPYNTTPLYAIGYSCGVAGLIILFVHNLHSLILFFNVLYFMVKHYNMFF